jgi:hypothetical protein
VVGSVDLDRKGHWLPREVLADWRFRRERQLHTSAILSRLAITASKTMVFVDEVGATSATFERAPPPQAEVWKLLI